MDSLPNIHQVLIDTFTNLITQFSSFISNFISALAIVLVGWLVAKTVEYMIRNLLAKIGVDIIGKKIQEIEPIRMLKTEVSLSRIVSKILFVLIMLFISVSAADKLGVPAISNMFLLLVNFIPKLIVALSMTIIGLFISDKAKSFVIALAKSFNIASGHLIGMAVFVFLAYITVILALGQAGINTALLESSFNIMIGGIGLSFAIGYGLASKEIMVNILSYFYSRNKYKVGDVIEIESIKGTIIKLENTSLILKTEEGEVVFPMRVLQSDKVTIYK